MKTLRAMLDGARERLTYHVQKAIFDFTESVSKVMGASNVSKSELANRLGCSQAFVTKLLRGRNNFTLETMVKVGRALNADLKVQLEPRGAISDWILALDLQAQRPRNIVALEIWQKRQQPVYSQCRSQQNESKNEELSVAA